MLIVLFSILLSAISSAELKQSDQTTQDDSTTSVSTCVDTCMQFTAAVNPANANDPRFREEAEHNCAVASRETAAQNQKSKFSQLRAQSYSVGDRTRKCLQDVASRIPSGIATGLAELGLLVWNAGKAVVTTTPKLPGMIYEDFQNARLESQARDQHKDECSKTIECTRRVARGLIQFTEMTTDGNFRLPNSAVDIEVAKLKQRNPQHWFDELWTKSLRDSNRARSECERLLAETMTAERNKTQEWTPEGRNRMLNTLHNKNPACSVILASNNIDLARILQTPVSGREVIPKIEPKSTAPRSLDLFNAIYQCKGKRTLDEFLKDTCHYSGEEAGKLMAGGPELKAIQMTANSIRGSKLVGGAASLSAERRAAKLSEATNSSRVATTRATTEFISQYGTKVHVSVEENQRFIDLARASNSGNVNRSTIFVTQENAIMKKLNSELGNKDMVTALTTFQQERFLGELDKLKSAYPELRFTNYQDFKSIQSGIEILDPVKFTPARRRQLMEDLDRAFAKANHDLKAELDRIGVKPEGMGSPDTWFRGGVGDSADRANLAARYARRTSNQTPGMTHFNAGAVSDDLKSVLRDSESMRERMAASPSFAPLLSTADGAAIPRSDVFDLVRKNSDPKELAAALNSRYKLNNFGAVDAALLQRYSKSVDEFSPSILTAKRETLDLSEANLGVVSADFVGLGGHNMRATAASMAGTTSLEQVVINARKAETAVTNTFNARKARFRAIVGKGTQCSGDDCVQVVNSVQTPRDKARTMDRIARDPLARDLRMTFVGPGVPQEYRMVLVTQGEAIEKALRKKLENTVDYSKLQNLTFGLDMSTVRSNEGVVNLVIGKKVTTNLSSSERIHIQRAFEEAIASVNVTGASFSSGYSRANHLRLRLVPNVSAVISDDEEP